MKFNKTVKILLLLTLIGLCSSCQVMHYLATDEPQDENPKEIKNYLSKNHITLYNYSFRIIDSLLPLMSEEKYAMNTYKLDHDARASPIQLRVYDSLGKLQNGYAQCYGPFKKLNILDSYPPRIIGHLPTNYNLKFVDDLDLWQIDEKTKDDILKKSKASTYTFVVYWNMWSKHFSKVVLEEMEKYVNEYSDKDIKFLYIIVNTGANSNVFS